MCLGSINSITDLSSFKWKHHPVALWSATSRWSSVIKSTAVVSNQFLNGLWEVLSQSCPGSLMLQCILRLPVSSFCLPLQRCSLSVIRAKVARFSRRQGRQSPEAGPGPGLEEIARFPSWVKDMIHTWDVLIHLEPFCSSIVERSSLNS